MKQGFAARGFELTPNNLRQVRVPAGAEALPNAAGMAPGFSVRIWAGPRPSSFPGVPREMERIFADQVPPRLARAAGRSGWPPPAVRTWHVYGMGESHIDHRLAGLLSGTDGPPRVSLHYRTAAPENHVKLVVRGPDERGQRPRWHGSTPRCACGSGPVIYGVDGETFRRAVARALTGARGDAGLRRVVHGRVSGPAGHLRAGRQRLLPRRGGGLLQRRQDRRAGRASRRRWPTSARSASRARARDGRGRAGAAGRHPGGVDHRHRRSPKGGWRRSASRRPTTGQAGRDGLLRRLPGRGATQTATKLFFGGRERIRRAAAYFALDLARRAFAASNDRDARRARMATPDKNDEDAKTRPRPARPSRSTRRRTSRRTSRADKAARTADRRAARRQPTVGRRAAPAPGRQHLPRCRPGIPPATRPSSWRSPPSRSSSARAASCAWARSWRRPR